jgi:hypothetical protein
MSVDRLVPKGFCSHALTIIIIIILIVVVELLGITEEYSCYGINAGDLTVCSGFGTCLLDNNCSCDLGHFGAECEVQISNFTLNEFGDSISALYISPYINLTESNFQSVIDCSALFTSQTLALLSNESVCYLGNKSLSVTFGASTMVTIENTIQVKIYPNNSNIADTENYPIKNWEDSVAYLSTVANKNPILPFARVTSPSLQYNCSPVILNASESFSYDARPIQFEWSVSCSNIAAEQELNSFLADLTLPIITIPIDKLNNMDLALTFQVKIISFLGYHSLANITIDYSYLPQIQISSIDGNITLRRSEGYMIRTNVQVSEKCGLYYPELQWTQIKGPQVDNLGVTNTEFLKLQPFIFPQTGITYQFQLRATVFLNHSSQVIESIFISNVYIIFQDLELTILGGNKRDYPLDSDLLLTSIPYDPDFLSFPEIYTWFCNIGHSTKMTCPSEINNSNLLIPAYSMTPGPHTFLLMYQKGNRNTSATVTINAIQRYDDGYAPEVVILNAPMNNTIGSVDTLRLRGVVYNFLASQVNFNWAIVSGNINLNNRILDTINTNQSGLAIIPNVLIPDTNYIFRLTTWMKNATPANITTNAEINIYVAPIPPVGTFSITPGVGNASSTIFTLMCSGCQDATGSLQFYFAFVDEVNGQNITYPLSKHFSSQGTMQTMLPQPMTRSDNKLYLKLIVRNNRGGQNEVYTSVIVYPPPIAQLTIDNIIIYAENKLQQLAQLPIPSEGIVLRSLLILARLLNKPIIMNGYSNETNCPNSCYQDKNQGVCENNQCVCMNNFFGIDCSLTEQQLYKKQAIREAILQNLLCFMDPVRSFEQLILRLSVLDVITQTEVEVSTVLLTNSTSYLSINIESNPLYIDSVILNLCSKLVNRFISLINSTLQTYLSTMESYEIIISIDSILSQLLSNQLNNEVPGELPTFINLSMIRATTYQNDAYVIDGQELKLSDSSDGSIENKTISLPLTFSESLLKGYSMQYPVIGVKFYSLTLNPFQYLQYNSSLPGNISSHVFSIIFEANGIEINVNDLQDPVTITVQGNFTYDTFGQKTRPVCRYWNITSNSWDTYGLITENYSPQEVQCLTFHTTSYAIFIEPYAPENTSNKFNYMWIILGILAAASIGTILIILSFIIKFTCIDAIKRKKVNSIHVQPQGNIDINHADNTSCDIDSQVFSDEISTDVPSIGACSYEQTQSFQTHSTTEQSKDTTKENL